jgi:hypothetical protein
MIDSLYIHKIAALRFSKGSTNSLGEPVYSSSVYMSSNDSTSTSQTTIPCRIEEYNEETEYRKSNLRLKNTTIIYIAPQYYLELADIIYDCTSGTSVYIGRIAAINNAVKAMSTDLDHYEIYIENP